MLQSKSQFHSGRGVVRLFGEGTSPWGQTLNPSLAHFIQLQRSLSIAYPDAPLQATTGLGTLPHVMAPSTIRLHVDAGLQRAQRGAGILIQVRASTPNQLRRGSRALILAYDAAARRYLVQETTEGEI